MAQSRTSLVIADPPQIASSALSQNRCAKKAKRAQAELAPSQTYSTQMMKTFFTSVPYMLRHLFQIYKIFQSWNLTEIMAHQ
jgi:hypothetical protein